LVFTHNMNNVGLLKATIKYLNNWDLSSIIRVLVADYSIHYD